MMDVTEQMGESEKAVYEKFRLRYPFRIVDFINALNIKVFARAMNDNQSGRIVKEGDDYKIFFNQDYPLTTIRFTLAYGLGYYFYNQEHLVCYKGFSFFNGQPARSFWSFLFRKKKAPRNPILEMMNIRANQFAEELLMPEKQFIEAWQQSSSPEEVALAFDVSVGAVKKRAYSLPGTMKQW